MKIPRFNTLQELTEFIEKEAKRRAENVIKIDIFLKDSNEKLTCKEISEGTGLNIKDVKEAVDFLSKRKSEKTFTKDDGDKKPKKSLDVPKDRIESLEKRVKQLEDKFEKLKGIL